MKNLYHGIPAAWKTKARRARCPHCKAEQWTHDGRMQVDHDRPDGRVCRKLPMSRSETTATEDKPI